MASKAETFRTKKSANGFILSDQEYEKSEKNRQTYDFSQFFANFVKWTTPSGLQ